MISVNFSKKVQYLGFWGVRSGKEAPEPLKSIGNTAVLHVGGMAPVYYKITRFYRIPWNLQNISGSYKNPLEFRKPMISVQWTPSESLIFLRNYWYSRSWGAAGRKINKSNGNTVNFTESTGI